MGVSFAIATAAVGCKGNDCQTTPPCGGNIVGTWKIISACETGQPPESDGGGCAQTAEVDSINASGSITYNPDGTYELTIGASVSETVTLSSGCLVGGPTPLTCQDLSGTASTGVGTESESCTTTSTGCSCQISANVPATQGTGTYVTSGTTLTMMGADEETDGYCVSGNTLSLDRSDADAGVLATGYLVATRQ